MPYFYQTPNKGDNYLSKSQKVHNQSRQGDWVCLNCNNLNFSFRKKCNRCKTQTRKDNESLQQAYSYYFYQDPYNQYVYQSQPHQLLTVEPYQQDTLLQDINTKEDKMKQDSQTQMIHFNQTPVKLINSVSPLKETQNIYDALGLSKKQKLSTPNSKKRSKINKQNQKLDLPSVSPLLKKYQAHQMETACDNSLTALFSNDLWGSHIKVVNFNVEQMQKSKFSSSGKKNKFFWQCQNQHQQESQSDKNSSFDHQIDDNELDLSQIINKIII